MAVFLIYQSLWSTGIFVPVFRQFVGESTFHLDLSGLVSMLLSTFSVRRGSFWAYIKFANGYLA